MISPCSGSSSENASLKVHYFLPPTYTIFVDTEESLKKTMMHIFSFFQYGEDSLKGTYGNLHLLKTPFVYISTQLTTITMVQMSVGIIQKFNSLIIGICANNGLCRILRICSTLVPAM